MFGFGSFSELPFSSVPATSGPASYTLNCSAGSYTLTGQSATLRIDRVLSASAGSYTITGQAATLKEGHALPANTGSYVLTGQAATLKVGRVLNAVNGSYTITGQAALLTKGNSYSLTANNGAYIYTGQDATFEYVPTPVTFVPTKGGIPKAKTHVKKNEHEDIAAIVKREFDILDGTYQPEAIEQIKEEILPQIKEVDYSEYDIALAQVNALLSTAKAKIQAYEAKLIQDELDDEEALLMLL